LIKILPIVYNTNINNQTGHSMNKNVVVTFGRMNPPTIGHSKLVDKIRTAARYGDADAMVFLSHSFDDEKNPIDYAQKFKFCKKAFGKVIQGSMARTPIEVMKELEKYGYENVTFVVGSDRHREMNKLLKKYNGIDYNFNTIRVASAGERDPDGDATSSMSASKMREYAEQQDLLSFTQGLPLLLQPIAPEVMLAVREGLNLN
jgi:nicotinic acid mononucleotide adenylyltransferase